MTNYYSSQVYGFIAAVLIFIFNLTPNSIMATSNSTSKTTSGKGTRLETQIIINARPEKVWAVFSDFNNYGTWNPFIKSIKGEVKTGNKIKAHIDNMKFKPKVLSFEENKELEWIGRLGFPGIFDGQHRFELIDNGDGTTTFIQSEKFKGILVGLMKKKLNTDIINNFHLMNEKLKEQVEN